MGVDCHKEIVATLTLSVPVVLLNSPNLSPYFSLNMFERILLLIFSSLLCLIISHFLITKCLILYMLCKEKLGIKTDKLPRKLRSVTAPLGQTQFELFELAI